MENNKVFEEKIKCDLKYAGYQVKPSDNLYAKIMKEVTNSNKNSSLNLKDKLKHTGYKNVIAALLCFFIIMAGISFSTSSNLRVVAFETLDKLKTIFVLDSTNKVVEKEADKAPLTTSVGRDTSLSDSELTKKVGFKVVFPEALSENLKLVDKSESVVVPNIDYLTGEKLQKDIYEAIDNQEKFQSLEKYNPTRDVSARYTSYIGDSIFINIGVSNSEFEKQAESMDVKKIDIDGIKGYWLDIPYPVYPRVKKNGINQYDLTKAPTEIKVSHQLFWFWNGLSFSITIDEKQDFSMEKAQGVAKTFMSLYSK
jgi:hypothetical protein